MSVHLQRLILFCLLLLPIALTREYNDEEEEIMESERAFNKPRENTLEHQIEVESGREWMKNGRAMTDELSTDFPELPPSPVLLHPILKSQSVILEPTITEGSYYIYCKLEEEYHSERDAEYLKQLMINSPVQMYSSQQASPIILQAEEMASVHSVSCLVQNVNGVLYRPVVIPMPLDVAEESPELEIVVSDVGVNSIAYVVSISIPGYLWCSVYPTDEEMPSIRELKRKRVQFVRDKTSFYQDNLIPNTEYSVYCYTESIRGAPMKELLSTVRTSTTTKELTMRIKSWSVSSHHLSFVVETNSNAYPSCTLNGVDNRSKGDGYYYFKIAAKKSYKLVCKSVFDTKVYRIQQTFVSPRNALSLNSVFTLFIITSIAIAVVLNYSSIVAALT